MTAAPIPSFRLAATVAHALPGVRLRLRSGDRTLLEVVRPPLPEGPAVTPCEFRSAVARARVRIEAGQRLCFLGLDEEVEPAIDVAVRPGDRIHPGGIYRVAAADGHVHAFVTTLAPSVCRPLLVDLDGPGAVGLHHDAATDVTLVHCRTGATGTALLPAVEDALARCVAEELARELATLGS